MASFNKTKFLALVAAMVATQDTLASATQTDIDAQIAASNAATAKAKAVDDNKAAVAAIKAEIEAVDENGDEPDEVPIGGNPDIDSRPPPAFLPNLPLPVPAAGGGDSADPLAGVGTLAGGTVGV